MSDVDATIQPQVLQTAFLARYTLQIPQTMSPGLCYALRSWG